MSKAKKGQIESAKVVIREVFSSPFWFCIPDYQRPYVWGKDEITELIDDISYAAKHNPEGEYFLGSMVLRKKTHRQENVNFEEHELLDGQQRLTTLMLILACVRDHVDDTGLKDTCRKMLYQKESTWENIPGRNRIIYNIRDNVSKFIKQHVESDNGSKNPNLSQFIAGKNLSLNNMAAGVHTIHNCFNDANRFSDQDSFNHFVRYLFNNVLFIYVATEDFDDAFRLFTILNDRGIPLSNSDILKARNLGAITDEKECTKWAEYWEEIEGELGRDGFDRFLSLVRTIYVKDKAREGLVKEFDERIYGAKLLTLGSKTFEVIKAYKDAYDKTILLNNFSATLGNAYRNRINIMRRGLPSTDWIPPVLAWYLKFGTDNLLAFVNQIDNKFSADWILQLTPTQRINNMNEILKSIELNNNHCDVFSTSVFDFDKVQLRNMFDGEIYSRRFSKYVLLRLEYLLADHTAQLNLPDEVTVEHILPQTLSQNSHWKKHFTQEKHELWLHRLGNLMLLSRRKNSSLGNLDFADKKARYFNKNIGSLPNSLRVLILPEFTLDALEERHTDLLNRLYLSY
jgi:uncharacterized protein with ParB-like and HNH nuclease domain